MTCIVGYIDKENDKVFIGADSAGIAGYSLSIRKDPKVFKVGEFVIGCTSSFRMIQLLNFSLELPELKKDENIYKYMCTTFVNSIRECFKNGGFLAKDKERDEGGCFLVGVRNRLFCIEEDFQVAELHLPFNAVGCGESYAKGALSVLHHIDSMEIKDKVLKSLEIASVHSAGVHEPFLICCT